MSEPRPHDAATASEIFDAAKTMLGAADQRYTRNRQLIVRTLHDADGPRTIGDLLEATPGLAQSSAYRNLAVLEEVGVIHRIVTADDHARFELTEAITGAHHHHLVCRGCGEVFDIALSDSLEEQIHEELAQRASERDFDGEHHRIDLVGTCAHC